MITEIRMEGVACYKAEASLLTDRKVNLIYGLNGTGKSTLSTFLYDREDPVYGHCRTVPEKPEAVVVYNQAFVRDTFHVADGLKGIFNLSRENKAAEAKIATAQAEILKLQGDLEAVMSRREAVKQTHEAEKQKAVEAVWKIKTTYTRGDRVLEYCLDGLKGQKDKLFAHLAALERPQEAPVFTDRDLKAEVEQLTDETAQPQDELPILVFAGRSIETDALHSEPIIGAATSDVAALIERLGNADWVHQGLEYLPGEIGNEVAPCPFCQERTVTKELVERINGYFDEEYRARLGKLERLAQDYSDACDGIERLETYTEHVADKILVAELKSKYATLMRKLQDNRRALAARIENPATLSQLADSQPALDDFNAVVGTVNEGIRKYNARLAHRDATLLELKVRFWQLMRWQFDQTLARYEADVRNASSQIEAADEEITRLEGEISLQKRKIIAAQKETVNVDEAVHAINGALTGLGIQDLRIAKHGERHYRVVRPGQGEDAFHTLSEGEKTMISFLYFCELCKGRTTPEDARGARVAVIDDPVSSLSHIYLFNVGQLIKSDFFRSDRFDQVFVLTHSLYFFYELTDTNHERRKESQKLFRMTKSAAGTAIREMKYEEVQNDYQAYWSIVNDPDQPPALIANCMRNIVEYFFGFVRRKDLNNVFQMPALQEPALQAFCRYMNRESHSFAQNVFDIKEFDYDSFREGLRQVFNATGYPDHYNEMSQV